ncbi:MAG: D-aminoacyl-tRNA deacylase [Limisphaerales bacterium]
MRAVIQRVTRARVTVAGETCAAIGPGLLVLLAVEEADTAGDAQWLADKIARLRIFADERGLMNRSVTEAGGRVLVVSQFTLFASTRKGNRPSFTRAARPAGAIPRYEEFLALPEAGLGQGVGSGAFGADMQVELVNDGPVTILMDTRDPE